MRARMTRLVTALLFSLATLLTSFATAALHDVCTDAGRSHESCQMGSKCTCASSCGAKNAVSGQCEVKAPRGDVALTAQSKFAPADQQVASLPSHAVVVPITEQTPKPTATELADHRPNAPPPGPEHERAPPHA